MHVCWNWLELAANGLNLPKCMRRQVERARKTRNRVPGRFASTSRSGSRCTSESSSSGCLLELARIGRKRSELAQMHEEASQKGPVGLGIEFQDDLPQHPDLEVDARLKVPVLDVCWNFPELAAKGQKLHLTSPKAKQRHRSSIGSSSRRF